MKANKIVIGGGGLSGLTLAILLSRKGYKIDLITKDEYPVKRVCGEYISMESASLLQHLGIDTESDFFPKINKLEISNTNGKLYKSELKLGGIGISRDYLDKKLVDIAQGLGVNIHFGNKIIQEENKNGLFYIKTQQNKEFQTALYINCLGKLSGKSISGNNEKNLWVGIKYHLKYELDKETISLHNFKNGYAGISAVEKDLVCFCYLVKTEELKKHGNIEKLEENILKRNPRIKNILENAEFIGKRAVISNFSFDKKTPFKNGLIYAGDSAGLIAPLCGNGMSMAFHSAYLLAEKIIKQESYQEIGNEYKLDWEKSFRKRLMIGRSLQGLFGNKKLTDLSLGLISSIPGLFEKLIELTHGKDFFKN